MFKYKQVTWGYRDRLESCSASFSIWNVAGGYVYWNRQARQQLNEPHTFDFLAIFSEG